MNEQGIFIAALQADPGDRSGYLDEACRGNEPLRRRVEKLGGEQEMIYPVAGRITRLHLGTTWGLIRAERSAEAERQAKVNAQSERENAVNAADAEKAAKMQAQKRLAQIEKANDILGSIFENLDPKEIRKNERPLQAVLVEKLDQAVAQLEGESIGDPLVVAAMQVKFSRSLLSLGESDKAIVLLEKARGTFQAKLDPDHPYTFTTMNSLALAYRDAGKLDLALPLFEETLKLKKAKLGPEHPHTLATMNNLAMVYQDAGKLDLALPLYEETLKLQKVKVGPDHPDTLATMNNLADAYRAVGKRDLALPLFDETFKLMKAKLGPDHPRMLGTMNNLAIAYQDAGKLDLALPLYEESFKLMKVKVGPDHPDTLASMNNLAIAYRDAGKRDLALPLFEETLKFMKAKLGPDHPDTLGTMNNLAIAYRDAGKLNLALPLFEETLKFMKAKLGPDHPDTLASMNNLAIAYRDAGKRDLALPLFEETLKFMKAKLGPDHPDTLGTMNNLAEAYLATAALQAWLGQDEDYAKTCGRALDVTKNASSATIAERTAKMCCLCPTSDKVRLELALGHARKAVKLGKNHPFLPWFQMALGMAEYRSGHFPEADAALLTAADKGKGWPELVRTAAFYRAMTLFRQGKEEEARKLALEAAKGMKPLPKDEKNPLPGGGNHNDLIVWLAYREAQALVKFEEASTMPVPEKK